MNPNTRFYGGVDRRTVDAVVSRPYGATSGRAWFVDATNGSDGNAGTFEAPVLTLAQAITLSAASQGDIIVIGPGTFTITAALVPKAGVAFVAGVKLSVRKPTVIITGNIADLVQVDVNNNLFDGIEFKASGNTADNHVDVADTAAVAGLAFHDCVFNGDDKTTVVGINAADATFALSKMEVRGCQFRDLTGTCIVVGVLGMAYSLIEDNQFALDVNAGVGISLADTGAFATGKGYVIRRNVFTGFDATAYEVGITIAGTENTTGAGIICDNRFAYIAAAAITIDKLSLSEVQNHYGD